MKNFLKLVTSSLLLVVLNSGCSLKSKGNDSNTPPSWVENPHTHKKAKNKVIGLGYSKTHFGGLRKQRQLAIASALDEIARQKGVKVSNTLNRMQVVGGSSSTSTSSMYSVQTVDGNSVTAKVVDSWKNQRTQELFILMVGE
jgi:hypothetical protein